MLTQSTTPYDHSEENDDNDRNKENYDSWDHALLDTKANLLPDTSTNLSNEN